MKTRFHKNEVGKLVNMAYTNFYVIKEDCPSIKSVRKFAKKYPAISRLLFDMEEQAGLCIKDKYS